ncbi:hypothetical protein GTA08_BOTSDO12403 [Botryosphaeria dothidea]|uniref:Uncharacterized protein n=1 Tax=Botryosphaeria dothidea TaxID=55169 RepID=A0A8H4J5B8_9PEZI|nr:hypothetical protein GTA08_BOTSDO02699 [Botryosphaeria dothidea]KAF4312082.1 hypothetical protein GTA08_BOTSDO12403 [Botryosphaeria dothidea]
MSPFRIPLPGPVCIVFYLTTFFILITAPTNPWNTPFIGPQTACAPTFTAAIAHTSLSLVYSALIGLAVALCLLPGYYMAGSVLRVAVGTAGFLANVVFIALVAALVLAVVPSGAVILAPGPATAHF